MSANSLVTWLARLETLSPHEIELGLERVLEVLARLALPRPDRVVHVAGTNGKGSCAALLEALLRQAGAHVGCYTSPHVLRYNERIRIDGQEAGDAEIVAAFEAVEAARQDVPLTYFEFGTLAALVIFARRGADSLVLEIGMGGRLDAVNAVEPDGGIITNVGLDHREWLGDDVETIAREKAGIMRPGKPVVFGARRPPASVLAEAARLGADLRLAGRDFDFEQEPGPDGRWCWRGRESRLEGLPRPSLAGRFQLQNAAAVLALLEALDVREALAPGPAAAALVKLELPGRLQWTDEHRRWLLDVAHNPDAARVLAESLDELLGGRPLTAVIGVLADKDVEGIVRPLTGKVSRWVAVTPDSPRALPAARLAQAVANLVDAPCLVLERIEDALAMLEKEKGEDVVLVTGSFYTVGPALRRLRGG